MTQKELHIKNLINSNNWIEYLKENSGLPGKRANLELLNVFVELGDRSLFEDCLRYDAVVAPTNTNGEFVAMCGAAGLGKLILQGEQHYYDRLKELSNDIRWRVREGVAFALQIIGRTDFKTLIRNIDGWKNGNPYVKRAVVAGLCEPALLKDIQNAEIVLNLLNEIVNSIIYIFDRKTESFRVLKRGLGYGLSVVIVSYPEKGKEVFENLNRQSDKEVKWILNENLKKKRLEKMDKEWTVRMKNASA
jgi:hypothetical protein